MSQDENFSLPTNHTRTREEGHTPACLAQAMICAIENVRDSLADDCSIQNLPIGSYASAFRSAAQDNFMHVADEYLYGGVSTCICFHQELLWGLASEVRRLRELDAELAYRWDDADPASRKEVLSRITRVHSRIDAYRNELERSFGYCAEQLNALTLTVRVSNTPGRYNISY